MALLKVVEDKLSVLDDALDYACAFFRLEHIISEKNRELASRYLDLWFVSMQ